MTNPVRGSTWVLVRTHQLDSESNRKGVEVKKIFTASLVLALFMPSLSVAMPLGGALRISRPLYGCHEYYTPQVVEHVALRIYARSRVSHRSLLRLSRYERCLIPGANRTAVRSFDRHQAKAWRARQIRARHRSTGGGWAIPQAIVMCESGGRNLPPNSATASGYYQIIRSTWARFDGYSDAYLAPKSVQDEKAAYIWAHEGGAEQWVCKA